jgi:hypothetical protein
MNDRRVIWQFAVGDPGEALNWLTLVESANDDPFLDFDRGSCPYEETDSAIYLTNAAAKSLAKALIDATHFHDQETDQ